MSVQVTFRTLKGDSFKLSAEPSDSVLDLKKKVGSQQNVSDHVGYRLIYKGKILPDDATVTSAGICEPGFVVVMPPKKSVAKPSKPAPPATTAAKPAEKKPSAPTPMDTTPATSAPSATPTTPSPAIAASASGTGTGTGTSVPSASGAADPAPSADPSNSLLTGDAFNESVKQLCEMGFPEDQVKKAMRAAFNNPDRAVDYLFNGIPDTAAPAPPAPAATDATQSAAPAATREAPETATPAPQQNASRVAPFNMFEAPPSGGANAGAGGGDGEGGGALGFLRSLPQFNMMRRLIQANPSTLPQILQLLEETYPSLLAIIDANQTEFTRLINEPLREGEDGGDEEVMEQLAQAMAGAGGSGGGQGGPGQIFVTEEEHAQIVRLSELGATIGLEESHVLQTWIACNRDETLTANFLVDHAEELRADMQQNGSDSPNPPDAPDSEQGGPPA